MAHYNHFSLKKYKGIPFIELGIGEKFKMDKFDGKRTRKDITMVKTSSSSYMEQKTKKEYNILCPKMLIVSELSNSLTVSRKASAK